MLCQWSTSASSGLLILDSSWNLLSRCHLNRTHSRPHITRARLQPISSHEVNWDVYGVHDTFQIRFGKWFLISTRYALTSFSSISLVVFFNPLKKLTERSIFWRKEILHPEAFVVTLQCRFRVLWNRVEYDMFRDVVFWWYSTDQFCDMILKGEDPCRGISTLDLRDVRSAFTTI